MTIVQKLETRSYDLQGKKIVAYEEGGSNGKQGADARSMVALLLVSSASSGTPLEAWLMPISGDSRSVCVSSNLLGAALFRPYQLSNAFLPLMVETRPHGDFSKHGLRY